MGLPAGGRTLHAPCAALASHAPGAQRPLRLAESPAARRRGRAGCAHLRRGAAVTHASTAVAQRPAAAKGSKMPALPFVRLADQEDMKLALMLNVIDPTVGGVLIMGDRGTGKSVAVCPKCMSMACGLWWCAASRALGAGSLPGRESTLLQCACSQRQGGVTLLSASPPSCSRNSRTPAHIACLQT